MTADKRIVDLAAATDFASLDVFPVVDVSDPTLDADGTTKKITGANLAAAVFDAQGVTPLTIGAWTENTTDAVVAQGDGAITYNFRIVRHQLVGAAVDATVRIETGPTTAGDIGAPIVLDLSAVLPDIELGGGGVAIAGYGDVDDGVNPSVAVRAVAFGIGFVLLKSVTTGGFVGQGDGLTLGNEYDITLALRYEAVA